MKAWQWAVSENDAILKSQTPGSTLTTPATDVPLLLRQSWLWIMLAVTALHLLVIALSITQITEYKPMNLINSAGQTSVQVSVISEPAPVPEPAEPPILTSERSEREIDARPAPHMAVTTPVVRPELVLKPPSPVKVRPAPRPAEKMPTEPKPTSPALKPTMTHVIAPAAQPSALIRNPAQVSSKDISTVGCRVPAPQYPRKAKRLKQQGEVLIRLVINTDGSLLHHDIARSSGNPELDDAAMAAVAGARCQPFIENGRAITVMTIQPVTFTLIR